MRRSARYYADVACWLLRSRFFAVASTPSANVAVVLTRSAISPVGPLCPSSPRCPSSSLAQRRVDSKTAMYWTGAMQLRRFHAVTDDHIELDDFLHKKPRRLKRTADFNGKMQSMLRDRSYSRILDLFEEMKTRGIKLDVTNCTAVMRAHSRMNNVDMVKRVFDESMTSGIKPDKFMFNTLIYAYTNTGEVDAAFKAFHNMHYYDIPPNLVTYRSLITVCGKGKDVDRARETFNEMNVKFKAKDARGFNVMLEVYAENVDRETGEAYLQECMELLAAMKAEGVNPDAFTYAHLIKLCGKLGRSEEALGYLKQSVSSGVDLAVPSFNFVIRSLMDLELTDEVLETTIVHCFDRMTKLKLKPSHVAFGSIIDLYEARGDVSKALEFLTNLCTKNMHGAARSGENFAAQLEIVQRLWESGRYSQEEALAKVHEIMKTMKSLRSNLSIRGYKTWFTICLKASDVERAFECWNIFTKGNRWPSVGMTQSIIRLALDHDRVVDAVRVLKFVQNDKRIMPTEDTYEAILAHCARKSDTENAKTVLESMKEAKVTLNEAIREHLGTLQLA